MRSLAIAAGALLVLASSVPADILWSQTYNTSSSGGYITAQDSPDAPELDCLEFDDFTVPSPGWLITRVTLYGEDWGSSALNQAVQLAFPSDHDQGAITTTYSGTEVGSDLVFDLPYVGLLPGSHWVTGWVQRDWGSGLSCWYWGCHDPVEGDSEAWFQNPGGGFMLGTSPLKLSDEHLFGTPLDMGFTLEGEVGVPEPCTLALVVCGGLAGMVVRRRRRS